MSDIDDTAGETAPTGILVPEAAGTGTAATAPTRARTRWGAIVWGLIVVAVGVTTLVVVGSPVRRLAVSDWMDGLTPGAFWILSVLVVGAIILVLALLALVRRAQRRRQNA